ncbi:MAG TPA: ferritin [Phycisphaerae bacterium]|nr:ferritin [Phycisphaerae bacterium]
MATMISAAMNAKLNKQVTAEFSASHEYMAMACAFDAMGLKALAQFFYRQSAEEREHATKLLKYILEVGATVALEAIPKPAADLTSAKTILKAALDAEIKVTKMINDLVALADKEKDYATRSFLQWYVDEQVEEVSSMGDLVQFEAMSKDLFHLETRVRHQMQATK